jgi:lysophospholipase L1-like esterase
MWKYAVDLKRISANPEIGHEHVPGSSARLMGHDVAINSAGLRDREIPEAKPDGATRVLMLGDSITFGWGVGQNETLPVRLAEEYAKRGAPAEVINSGVGNYNTAMEVAWFRERGLAYAPDVVVLNYFINDAEPTPVYRDVPWLARRFYAYPVLGGAWDAFKRRVTRDEQDWRSYYAGLYAEGAPGWEKAQREIAALASLCREKGIRLVIAHIPELRELAPYAFPEVQTKVQAVAAANGIEYVDLLPAVAGAPPDGLWVTVPDPHPNARAQIMFARELAEYLTQKPSQPTPE